MGVSSAVHSAAGAGPSGGLTKGHTGQRVHGPHMVTGHPLREEVAESADTLIATPHRRAKKRAGSRHDLLGERDVVMASTLRGHSASQDCCLRRLVC